MRGTYLLTALASGWSRHSRSPSGCTFPWGTAGHLGESVASTGEVQQPLLRNRPRDSPAVRGLLPPEGQGLGPPASLLPRARLMGEGQAVPQGRVGGPGGGDGGTRVPV